ncbi:uncharacterized protein [Euphorbia lathyris]|uniref:uncharacterized protein n=1 Tax=Euphorbia lathyris TaxID=212925 RepID=UPI0033130B3D
MVVRIGESSVYFIHPSENPALVLVTSPLSGLGDYHSWSQNMKMALLSKNKLDFVDGTIDAPERDSDMFQDWKRCNNLVLSWVIRSVSPSIQQSVLWLEDARKVWDNLKERFAQSDIFRVANLQGEIFTIKQGMRNVSEYFTCLQKLWDEFISIRSIPKWVCEGCVCNALYVVQRDRNLDQVICFLKGLNDSFSTIRSQIMVMDPLPNINKTFSLIIQFERQNVVQDSALSENFVAFVQNNKLSKKCAYCGFKNHTVDTCYKKHGYPPGYKFKNKMVRANMVDNEVFPVKNDEAGILGAVPQAEKQIVSQLTPEQITQLLKLIHNTQTSFVSCATTSVCPTSTSMMSELSDGEDDWIS